MDRGGQKSTGGHLSGLPAERAKKIAGGLARRFRAAAARAGCGPAECLAVGSVRRGEARARDLDLLLVVPDRCRKRLSGLGRALEAEARRETAAPLRFLGLRGAGGRRVSFEAETLTRPRLRSKYVRPQFARERRVNAEKARKRRLVTESAGKQREKIVVDVFVALERERPFALFHYTGPRSYNVRTRAHAKRRGWLLNQYGIFYETPPGPASGRGKKKSRRVRGSAGLRTEAEVARFLGLTVRPPSDRE